MHPHSYGKDNSPKQQNMKAVTPLQSKGQSFNIFCVHFDTCIPVIPTLSRPRLDSAWPGEQNYEYPRFMLTVYIWSGLHLRV